MNTSQATLTMALLFALRCLVPMAFMFGIGYGMNWLVDRWEAEAEEALVATAVPTKTEGTCWAFKQCNPELQKDCPGFKQQMTPCWLVRTRAEGALPNDCLTCPIYEQAPSFA